MAGNYPDVPSNRMSYDRDGTQCYRVRSDNTITQMTAPELVVLNNENADHVEINSGAAGGQQMLVVYFPERRDVVAYYALVASLGNRTTGPVFFEVSTNTTNGLDGTWTQIGSTFSGTGGVPVPGYRTDITSASALGVQAVRLRASGPSWEFDINALHLFGNPAAGQNPNRLAIWHPTSDVHVTGAYFDWGNTPRSSSQDRTFRVKNISSTLTAVGIGLGLETLTDATPSVPAQHLLSTDGSTFTALISIGNLAPGGLSGVLTVRRVTPTNAQLSVWALRVFAQATSWS